MTLPKPDRDRDLIYDYVVGGLSRREVAAKYGLSDGGLCKLLHTKGVVLSKRERTKRRKRAGYENVGRPPVWPDCPPELREEYETLRRYYGSAEARSMIEERLS